MLGVRVSSGTGGGGGGGGNVTLYTLQPWVLYVTDAQYRCTTPSVCSVHAQLAVLRGKSKVLFQNPTCVCVCVCMCYSPTA